MRLRENFTCPLELVHDMMKGKWKRIIVWRLRLGPTAPSGLLRDIEGITEKMLRQHLSELIDFELVERTVYEGYPLRSEYALTKKGQEVLRALEIYQNLALNTCSKMAEKISCVIKALFDTIIAYLLHKFIPTKKSVIGNIIRKRYAR